jgi:hypothetical protein
MSRERRTIPPVRHGKSDRNRDCPLAPPSHATVQSRTLHRVCLIVGGVDQLAARLHVEPADVRRWMTGEAPTPERIFEACVEILLLYAADKGAAN